MLNGHDGGDPNWDALGIFYMTFAVVWTCVIAAGLICLYILRDNVAIRIRNLWLTVSSVIVIHLYILAVLMVYVMNGLFTCGLEFWIMSTILPFGIALFQAANIQLLSYYEEQQNLVRMLLGGQKRRFTFTPQGLITHWKQLTTVQKTYASILIGLGVQLIITFILFFGSRIFHSSFGFFGVYQGEAKCRHGKEWVPSVFWQFLWAAVFGPYVLYRIRFIKDTHYWALQTRLAIIACLPGTPMWLAFLYSEGEGVKRVNKYFVAAGWFLPGLITMQLVSILIPLWDAHRNKATVKRASSLYSVSTSSTVKARDQYSMAALETQIQKNIEPLLRFASQKEFTAENVVFLKAVRDYKKKWELAAKKAPLNALQLRERFEEAAVIYFTLVNANTAKFNVNIDFRIYSDLEDMFKGLEYEPYMDDSESRSSHTRTENVVTPWTDVIRPTTSTSKEKLVDDVERLYPAPVTEIEMTSSDTSIPPKFNIDVFDKAYESVRYLVLTNTWVKFVDAGETMSVADSEHTVISATESQFSFNSKPFRQKY